MFCLHCQAGYRQGFTRCADCDVDLVYELPPESRAATSPCGGEFADREPEFRLVLKGNEEAECLVKCRELLKADIPYKVAQTPAVRDFRMRVKWLYEIGVLDADCRRAKGLLGIEGEFENSCYDERDEEEEQAAGGAESLPPDHAPADPETRNDSYLKPWYPEDATVDIWSQDRDDISSSVAMALRENLIHCRLDRQYGFCKIFVRPEDEPRAREIVPKIVEDHPPR
jgi:hypothetical protein